MVAVEKGDVAFPGARGDLGDVRVGGVWQHLDGGGAPARAPPGKIPRHHHSDVESALAELSPE